MKKLIPAIVLLLISAMIMATASYAWFSMNTTVTATGMTVQAKAENGIVISNSAKTDWKETASSTTGASVALYPTNTKTGDIWFHSASTDASLKHAGGIGYSVVVQGDGKYTLTADTTFKDGKTYYTTSDKKAFSAATVTTGDSVAADTYYEKEADTTGKYYQENVYYVRSSSAEALAGQTLQVSSVTITLPDTTHSENLDKSIRVLVKAGTSNFIYRLTADDTGAYYLAEDGSTFTATVASSSLTDKIAGISSIPASTGTPIEVKIYVYFEGESNYCISNNATNPLDEIQVEVKLTAVSAS